MITSTCINQGESLGLFSLLVPVFSSDEIASYEHDEKIS